MPSSTLPSTGVPHLDKVTHFLLYAILGALLVPAVVAASAPRMRAVMLALAAVAAFAAVDEWHQRFIPGRSADVADFAADLAGATFALLLLAARAPRHETIT